VTPRTCKDCTEPGREARFPGPRCFAHHRDRQKALAARQHARHIETVYALTADQYDAQKAAQGGVCAICRRATGKTKRLAVDHDHRTGLVRGLLCGPCNRDLIGRHPVPVLARAIEYLTDPPAPRTIGPITVPTDKENP
jgi:hypothetical protein